MRIFLRLVRTRCLKYLVILTDQLTKNLPMDWTVEVRLLCDISSMSTIILKMLQDRTSFEHKEKDRISANSNTMGQLQKKEEQFEVYQYQVSGKTPKYIDNVRGLIYKIFSKAEYEFYEYVKAIKEEDQRYGLKAYIPEYLGLY